MRKTHPTYGTSTSSDHRNAPCSWVCSRRFEKSCSVALKGKRTPKFSGVVRDWISLSTCKPISCSLFGCLFCGLIRDSTRKEKPVKLETAKVRKSPTVGQQVRMATENESSN